MRCVSSAASSSNAGPEERPGAFPPTRWSLVTVAGASASPAAVQALGELLRAYWPPLYAFARRAGWPPADAADAVQGFCETLVRRETLRTADPARGRLRSFLLGAFRNHLGNARRDRARQRRGGTMQFVPLDGDTEAVDRAVAQEASPAAAFERRWVLTLLARALARLRDEYVVRGREALFARLEPLLAWGERTEGNLAQLAAELRLSEAAVQQAVRRMRARYRALVEAEIGETVSDAAEIAEERQHLIRVLSQ